MLLRYTLIQGWLYITMVKGKPPRSKVVSSMLGHELCMQRFSSHNKVHKNVSTTEKRWNIPTGRTTCPWNAGLFPQPPSAGEMSCGWRWGNWTRTNSMGSLSARLIRLLPLLNNQLPGSKNDTMLSIWSHPSRGIVIHLLALWLHLNFSILEDKWWILTQLSICSGIWICPFFPKCLFQHHPSHCMLHSSVWE